jgi:hypothetical protein
MQHIILTLQHVLQFKQYIKEIAQLDTTKGKAQTGIASTINCEGRKHKLNKINNN